MLRCVYVEWSGFKVAFHHPELVFNLSKSMIFFNHLLCIHSKFGGYDLIIPHAFFVFGNLVKIKESLHIRGIYDLPGLLIHIFLFQELTQAFRLQGSDSKVLRRFFQLFQKL